MHDHDPKSGLITQGVLTAIHHYVADRDTMSSIGQIKTVEFESISLTVVNALLKVV